MGHTGATKQLLQITLTATLLLLGAGCKKMDSHPASTTGPVTPSTQQISADITSKLNSEAALNGQDIGLNVADGKVTLTGTVRDEASRSLAANDAASVSGVRTVINNLVVEPLKSAAVPIVAPKPMPMHASARKTELRKAQARTDSGTPKPTPPQQPTQQQAPEQVRVVPPPTPSKPIVRTVTIPTGTTIPIRMVDALESGKTLPNSTFRATLASDLVVEGTTAIARGSSVLGRVVEAKDATHYTGGSMLTIELTQITAQGQTLRVFTDPYSAQGKARGSNTAKKVGGGAALGAIIGALAGGGKGAAIGAAAGGGVGAGANTVTKGDQVQIASETVVNFRLQNPLSVTTTTYPHQARSNDTADTPVQPDPTLQQRQQQ